MGNIESIFGSMVFSDTVMRSLLPHDTYEKLQKTIQEGRDLDRGVDDVVANAEKKLSTKHADLVVANQVGEGKAFGTDDNQVWFVDDEGVEELPRMSKERLADAILDKALEFVR